MKKSTWIAAGLVIVLVLMFLVVFGDDEKKCVAGGGAGVVNSNGLARPIDKQYPINSGFGMRWGSAHNGVDFAAPRGTDIYAMADGKVIAAADTGITGFGGWVVIQHKIDDQDYSTVYGHMEPGGVFVSTGQSVTAGQRIAAVGSAGQSTGPHLHFEVHNGNRLANGYSGVIDPTSWIASIDAGTPAARSRTSPGDKSDSSSQPGEIPASVSGFDAVSTLRARQIIDGGQQRGVSENVIIAALAAGIVESGLKMLASRAVPESMKYENDGVAPGDYDSVGLFQTRVSIWGPPNGGVEGLMNPATQIKWFYDTAASVATTGKTPGDIAADVERPREDLRYKYSVVVPQAVALYAELEGVSAGSLGELAGLCVGDDGELTSSGGGIVEAARRQAGAPYVWGGGDANGPTTGLAGTGTPGFDCSGLVLYAVAQATGGKLVLDHSSVRQGSDPRLLDVAWEDRRPGDLLFFGPDGAWGHTSIYSGEKDGKPMQIEAQDFGTTVGEYPVRKEQVKVRRVVFDDTPAETQSDSPDTKNE